MSDVDLYGYRRILSEHDSGVLRELSASCDQREVYRTATSYADVALEFTYGAARLEGIRIDRDTAHNLLSGDANGGKDNVSRQCRMLLNVRAAFDTAMYATQIDTTLIAGLHAALMRGLADDQTLGAVRGGSPRLQMGLQKIVRTSAQYVDLYERAIYLHCNLAHLRCFSSGNAQVAFCVQVASMVVDGVLPIVMDERLVANYQKATLEYIESGDHTAYVEFFTSSYAYSVGLVCGGSHRLRAKPRA